MNILCVNKQFDSLNRKENAIKFLYEPHMKKLNPSWKRHIYYKELQNDFSKEITAFGFSPYIQQESESQRKNIRIMKYHSERFNCGLFNYVKKKNVNPVIPNNSHRSNSRLNNKSNSVDSNTTLNKSNNLKSVNDPQCGILENNPQNEQNSLNMTVNKDFLSNALRKIANSSPKNRNNHLNDKVAKKFEVSTTYIKKTAANTLRQIQFRQINFLRERYQQSLKQLNNFHPALSNSVDAQNNTFLRKYQPEFDKTLNPVNIIKKKVEDVPLVKKELQTLRKKEKIFNITKKIDRRNRYALSRQERARMGRSAYSVHDKSNLFDRAQRNTEIIFYY